MLPEQLHHHPSAVALGEFDPEAIAGGKCERGELTLEIEPARIVAVCRYLKATRRFNRLSSVTAVDRYPMEPRFEVVYHLHSLERNERIRLKCRTGGESPEIDSVTPVWRGADWYEREVFDLFGIRFRNHPNLTRILMPEDWQGHPLRKDFPTHGHKNGYQGE